jgi:hypothetical protein
MDYNTKSNIDKPELAATGMAAWTRMLGKVFFCTDGRTLWAHASQLREKITCASGILVGLD